MGPTDEQWTDACRRAVEVQKRVFEEHRTIAQRTQYEDVGAGGDRTLTIDRLCEDAVFAELEALHEQGHSFTAVSEERGSAVFGDGEHMLPLRGQRAVFGDHGPAIAHHYRCGAARIPFGTFAIAAPQPCEKLYRPV